jgi:hypothetical protein
MNTLWVSRRSLTGRPVLVSVTVTTTRAGRPGRVPAGTLTCTCTSASAASTGGISVVIIVPIVGRIGMPADSVQASVPFMPRWAVSVWLAAVSPTPTAMAAAATVVR